MERNITLRFFRRLFKRKRNKTADEIYKDIWRMVRLDTRCAIIGSIMSGVALMIMITILILKILQDV